MPVVSWYYYYVPSPEKGSGDTIMNKLAKVFA